MRVFFLSSLFKRIGYFYFFRIIISLVLSLSFVLADECSWVNIGDCITETLFDFLNTLFYSPIKALVSIVESQMMETTNLMNFSHMWAIIVYILSLFYGLFILYAGFNLIISGHNPVKRAESKEWLQNIVIMIVLIQMSYFIYAAIIGINSALTSIILVRVNQSFFNIGSSISNIALSIIFSFLAIVTLLITILLFGLRYIIVNFGVVCFPIAIFLYFIPSMKEYGKSIINFLLTSIFISFFSALIVYVCSMGVSSSAISSYGILIIITSFTLVNLLTFYFMFFSLIKSVSSVATKVVVLTKVLG